MVTHFFFTFLSLSLSFSFSFSFSMCVCWFVCRWQVRRLMSHSTQNVTPTWRKRHLEKKMNLFIPRRLGKSRSADDKRQTLATFVKTLNNHQNDATACTAISSCLRDDIEGRGWLGRFNKMWWDGDAVAPPIGRYAAASRRRCVPTHFLNPLKPIT